MKLHKSLRLSNGIVVPRGTVLNFSTEGFANYKGSKVPKVAIEGNDTLTIKGEVYKLSWIKHKGQVPVFTLILIPANKNKETVVLQDFATYSEGWSQGTNRSVRGWYLNTPSGGASNGSGKSSPATPNTYDLKYDIDDISAFIEGKPTFQDYYKKNAIKRSGSLKLSDIKSEFKMQ